MHAIKPMELHAIYPPSLLYGGRFFFKNHLTMKRKKVNNLYTLCVDTRDGLAPATSGFTARKHRRDLPAHRTHAAAATKKN